MKLTLDEQEEEIRDEVRAFLAAMLCDQRICPATWMSGRGAARCRKDVYDAGSCRLIAWRRSMAVAAARPPNNSLQILRWRAGRTRADWCNRAREWSGRQSWRMARQSRNVHT